LAAKVNEHVLGHRDFGFRKRYASQPPSPLDCRLKKTVAKVGGQIGEYLWLKNPNGLILGHPGSGKSFSAQRETTNAFLITLNEQN